MKKELTIEKTKEKLLIEKYNTSDCTELEANKR